MKHLYKYVLFLFILGACSNDDVQTPVEQGELTLAEVATDSPNQPTWIPREEMKSRNGESMGYGVFLNPNSQNLIIFLDGGGACFNSFTCNSNLASYSEEDFYERAEAEKALIINRDSEDNQFKDWNFVFVPYATGDVHSSDNSSVNVPDGGPENQTMKGYNNVTIVLNDLKNYFDSNSGITEIVFTGSSAGGFGTLTNTLQLSEILGKDIPTTVIVDAGQVFMDETILTPCLVNKWESLWNISSFLPDDLEQTVQKTYAYDIQKVYEYLSVKLPNYNFGFLSYYQDNVNRGFYSFGQDNCPSFPLSFISGEEFKAGLIDLKISVLDDFDNWKVFYKEGTSHTFLNSETLSQTINETSLNNWISQLRQGTAVDLVE